MTANRPAWRPYQASHDAQGRPGLAWPTTAVMAALLALPAMVWTMADKQTDTSGLAALPGAIAKLPGQIRRADPAAPDLVGGIYGGFSHAYDSDLRLRQPGGTDMVIRNVSWSSAPYKSPPYHGFRGTWWLPAGGTVGAMGDLVYIKVIAERDRVVEQSGIRDGKPVPKREKLSATFRRLEFTDGLNLLTGNLIYRIPLPGRLRPYIAVGVGISLPHAEVRRTGAAQRTFEFQLAGYAMQIIAGLEFRLADRGSAFAEMRSSYATNTVSLVDGGTLEMNLLVNHASAGLSGHLRPMLKPAAP